jgi:hypothetical protein
LVIVPYRKADLIPGLNNGVKGNGFVGDPVSALGGMAAWPRLDRGQRGLCDDLNGERRRGGLCSGSDLLHIRKVLRWAAGKERAKQGYGRKLLA